MTTSTISAPTISSGVLVSSGDVLVVQGGEIVGTVVSSGGMVEVIGGSAIGTTVNAGGILATMSGGMDSATILNGGFQQVTSGGSAISSFVGSGAYQTVQSGQTSGVVIGARGEQILYSGSTTSTVISSGGTEIVQGGIALDSVVTSGGLLTVQGQVDVIPLGSAISGQYSSFTQVLLQAASASGTQIGNQGTDLVEAGGYDYAAVVSNGGVLENAGGNTFGALISSGGQEQVYSGAVDSGATVESFGIMRIWSGGTATSTSLQVQGGIEFVNVGYASSDTLSFNSATNTLTVSGGGVSQSIQLLGSYANDTFALSQDTLISSGTDVTLTSVPCYCEGTLILTDQGEKPVEALEIGDVLITASGAHRPIRWIGTRAYAGTFANRNRKLLPVRFQAGSLADGVPARDLSVSPLHAMFLDGMLIPAEALVNGANVTQATSVDAVAYFHIELDSHDVIIAEGAASETYLDHGNRAQFHNVGAFDILYPDAEEKMTPEYYARRVEQGAELEAVRRRIAARSAQQRRA